MASKEPASPFWTQPVNMSFFAGAAAVPPQWQPIAPLSFGDMNAGFGQRANGVVEDDGQVEGADVQIKKGEGLVQVPARAHMATIVDVACSFSLSAFQRKNLLHGFWHWPLGLSE